MRENWTKLEKEQDGKTRQISRGNRTIESNSPTQNETSENSQLNIARSHVNNTLTTCAKQVKLTDNGICLSNQIP